MEELRSLNSASTANDGGSGSGTEAFAETPSNESTRNSAPSPSTLCSRDAYLFVPVFPLPPVGISVAIMDGGSTKQPYLEPTVEVDSLCPRDKEQFRSEQLFIRQTLQNLQLERSLRIRSTPAALGCQSPCGNLWLAAAAFLLRDPALNEAWIQEVTADGGGGIQTTHESQVYLSPTAAHALIEAFMSLVYFQDSSSSSSLESGNDPRWDSIRRILGIQEYPNNAGSPDTRIQQSLWTTRTWIHVVQCRLEQIPSWIQDFLYVLEISSTEHLTRQIRPIPLSLVLQEELVNEPSDQGDNHKILLLRRQGSPPHRCIAVHTTLPPRCPHPKAGSTGKLTYGTEFGPDTSYDRVLGLVHTVQREIFPGADVWGDRTAWIGNEDDASVVYLTDRQGTGRWYRIGVHYEDRHAVVRGDYGLESFVRLVCATPRSNRKAMAMKLGRLQRDLESCMFEGCRENLPGLYLTGQSIALLDVVFGYSPTRARGDQAGRIAVADPGVRPRPLEKKMAPFLLANDRSSGRRIDTRDRNFYIKMVWQPVHFLKDPSWETIFPVMPQILGIWSLANLILATLLLIIGLGLSDEVQKQFDVITILVLGRLLFEALFRVILALVAWKGGLTFPEILWSLLTHSVDTLELGLPWIPGDIPFYWRRLSLRVRAACGWVALLWALLQIVVTSFQGDFAQTIGAVFSLALGAPVILNEGGLGRLLDEFCGGVMGCDKMIAWLVSCVIADIGSSAVVFSRYNDFSANKVIFGGNFDSFRAMRIAAIVIASVESAYYALTLLRARAVLQKGRLEDSDVAKVITGISESSFLTLQSRIQAAADTWGLGGVANHPSVRGILSLFEDLSEVGNWPLQATKPQTRLSDWVSVTQADWRRKGGVRGFKIFPMLRGNSFEYQARYVETNLRDKAIFNRNFKVSRESHPYGNVRMAYVDPDIPWTGSRFRRARLPLVAGSDFPSKLPLQREATIACPAYLHDHMHPHQLVIEVKGYNYESGAESYLIPLHEHDGPEYDEYRVFSFRSRRTWS